VSSRRAPRELTAERLADFLANAGRQLLTYACPAHRLEETLTDLAKRFGCVAEVFCVPSGLWLSVARPGDSAPPVVRLARVGRWSMNLDRLAALDELFDDVAAGRVDLDTAEDTLMALVARPRPWRQSHEWAAGAAAGAAAVVLYGGRWAEAVMGAGLGLALAVLSTLVAAQHHARHLGPFVFGALSASTAWLAASISPELATQPLVVAGLIQFVPGTTLTVGLSELVQKNIVSGTGRLLDAMMVLLSMVFGVMLVVGLAQAMGVHTDFLARRRIEPVPLAALALGMLAAGASFAVIARVPRRWLVLALGGCLVAGASIEASRVYFPEVALCTFFGALATGLYANACARWTRRPAQLFLVPGMVLLVPGMFGFMSFGRLFTGDIEAGAAGAFQTLMVGAALATGIVAANTTLPPRKSL
jgi:uncharacterized membrane protein YjjP (DUF1212 family)